MDAAFNNVNEHTLTPKTGTDRGVCNTISPEVDFHPDVISSPDPGIAKRVLYKRGTTSGKENGLSLLIDTESYDHGFKGSPGAGVSLLLHHHGDQPIMGSGSIRHVSSSF